MGYTVAVLGSGTDEGRGDVTGKGDVPETLGGTVRNPLCFGTSLVWTTTGHATRVCLSCVPWVWDMLRLLHVLGLPNLTHKPL